MKKRILSLVIAGLVGVSAILTGCGGFDSKSGKEGGSSSGKVLRLAVNNNIPTFDPAQAQDDQSSFLLSQMYEGLTSVRKDGKAELSQAEKIDTNDDKSVWTFTLKDGIKWSNGDPVKASDYKFAWLRTLAPETASDQAERFFSIKNAEEYNAGKAKAEDVGIEAKDDKTLVVTLKGTNTLFDQIVTYANFFPLNEKAVKASKTVEVKGEKEGDKTIKVEEIVKDPTKAIINGPYKMATLELGKRMVLEKNDKYYKVDEVNIPKVNISIIKDEATVYQLFKAKELDWIGAPAHSISTDHMDEAMKSPEYNKYDMSGIYWYKLNTENKFLKNVHLRKALNMAMNRQDIIDFIVKTGTPATGYVPGEPEKYFKDNDIEGAKKELAIAMKELNITKPEDIKLTVYYNTSEGHQKIAQAIQEQWKKALGINIGLKNEEWKVYLATTLKNTKFDIARLGWVADVDDPSDFLKYYADKDGGNNNTKWFNKEFKELIDKSIVEPDNNKRLDLLRKAEKIMTEEVPVIPIYFTSSSSLKHDNVDGLELTKLKNLYLKKGILK